MLVSHLVKDDASRIHRESVSVNAKGHTVRKTNDDSPFGDDEDPFVRIVDAELMSEAPGYRDLLIRLEFATTTENHVSLSSQLIRLTPRSFEQLSGILQRSIRSWRGQPPTDVARCPHTSSPA